MTNRLPSSYAMTPQTPRLDKFPNWEDTVKWFRMLERADIFDTFVQASAANTVTRGVKQSHYRAEQAQRVPGG